MPVNFERFVCCCCCIDFQFYMQTVLRSTDIINETGKTEIESKQLETGMKKKKIQNRLYIKKCKLMHVHWLDWLDLFQRMDEHGKNSCSHEMSTK